MGVRKSVFSSSPYMSSSNFGSCVVPTMHSRFTMKGGLISVYPCCAVCRSSRKLISARSSRAPAPVKQTKPLPLIFAARSRSNRPSRAPTCRWSCGWVPGENRLLAPGAHHRVVRRVPADGRGGVGEIGDVEQERALSLVGLADLAVERGDLLADAAYLRLQLGGGFAAPALRRRCPC